MTILETPKELEMFLQFRKVWAFNRDVTLYAGKNENITKDSPNAFYYWQDYEGVEGGLLNTVEQLIDRVGITFPLDVSISFGVELDSQPEDVPEPVEFTHYDCWGIDDDGEEVDNIEEIKETLLKSFEKLTGESFDTVRGKLYNDEYAFLSDCTPILLRNGFNVYDSDTCYEVYSVE